MDKAGTDTFAQRTFRGNREARLALNVEEPDLTWRVLTTTNLLRLVVAALSVVLFFSGSEPRIFGNRYPSLFPAVAAGYLVFALVSWVARFNRLCE